MKAKRQVLPLLCAAVSAAALGACGRIGPPKAPGPPSEIHYPRLYPKYDLPVPTPPPAPAAVPALELPAPPSASTAGTAPLR
jgi:hypothetical protein